MLRYTRSWLVKSHQLKKAEHPNASTRFGRNYNRSFIKYGFGGFGMSVYSTRKGREPKIQPPQRSAGAMQTPLTVSGGTAHHLSTTTKSLSPHWRSFALQDGGVLFAHPSHKQVMLWSQDTLKKEAEATGMTTMDQWVNSRIQSIIADHTIENVSLSHWRKRHIWTLLKKRGNMVRHTGTPDVVKGSRTTWESKGGVIG